LLRFHFCIPSLLTLIKAWLSCCKYGTVHKRHLTKGSVNKLVLTSFPVSILHDLQWPEGLGRWTIDASYLCALHQCQHLGRKLISMKMFLVPFGLVSFVSDFMLSLAMAGKSWQMSTLLYVLMNNVKLKLQIKSGQ